MNDAAPSIIGGTLFLVLCLFGVILAVYWAVLPLIITTKLGQMLRQQQETNSHLAVVSHQLTVQNRPPVVQNPEQTLHTELHMPDES